ncbi:MAG: hypothetical protein JNL90_16665 [Planctomycetes bacterium]|nr:hypothetical protein [Planctomycetota bacterium]
MVFEKLTSLERLATGAPLLLTAVIVHGLGLAGGLAALRMRTLQLRAAEANGGGGEVATHGTRSWAPGEAWLLLALPLVWWFGFILGPEDPAMKGLANSLGEPALVAALGIGYLAVRRVAGRSDHAVLPRFALLALALALAGLLGWLFPQLDFGPSVP